MYPSAQTTCEGCSEFKGQGLAYNECPVHQCVLERGDERWLLTMQRDDTKRCKQECRPRRECLQKKRRVEVHQDGCVDNKANRHKGRHHKSIVAEVKWQEM